VNLFPYLFQSHARLETGGDLRSLVGRQHVPALGFAARIAVLLRHLVVRMHLDAQLFLGENHLDQQRRCAVGRVVAQHDQGMLGKHAAQFLSGAGAGGHNAVVAGEPDFAQRIFVGHLVIPGAQIHEPPHPDIEVGLDAKRARGESEDGSNNAIQFASILGKERTANNLRLQLHFIVLAGL